MKFHSDLFGWEYVWRNFADLNAGVVNTATAAADSAFVSMTVAVPVGDTGKSATLLIAPANHHGKKSSGIKIMAPFEALEDFVFSIFPETLGSQFGKVVGMQDIKVLDHLFDSKFMVQGNHPQRVVDLFGNVNLRELLLLQPPARLAIETKQAKSEKANKVSSSAAKYHAVVYQFDGAVDKLHQLETAVGVVSAVLEHVLSPYDSQTADHYVASAEEDGATTHARKLRSPLLDHSHSHYDGRTVEHYEASAEEDGANTHARKLRSPLLDHAQSHYDGQAAEHYEASAEEDGANTHAKKLRSPLLDR